MFKNKEIMKILNLILVLILILTIFLTQKSFGSQNYELEIDKYFNMDKKFSYDVNDTDAYIDTNTDIYTDTNVDTYIYTNTDTDTDTDTDIYTDIYTDTDTDTDTDVDIYTDMDMDMDIIMDTNENIDVSNDDDYYNYDYDYDYDNSIGVNKKDDIDYIYNNNDDDFANFDFGNNKINNSYPQTYSPYSQSDFPFIDDVYNLWDWSYEEKEKYVPGDKFLTTPKTIQYLLSEGEKYPIYTDTGIQSKDGIFNPLGLKEALSQITIKKGGKLIEDENKFMLLIDKKLLIIEKDINEEMLEKMFEKTSVEVKVQSTRAGGKFNLVDYLENYKTLSIKVNEKLIELVTEPLIDNSKVLFPIRSIAVALDANVEWNKEKSEATIIKDDKIIKLFLDDDVVFVNNNKYLISNKTKMRTEEERLLSVIQLIVIELNGTMEWDSTNYVLIINTPQEEINLDEYF